MTVLFVCFLSVWKGGENGDFVVFFLAETQTLTPGVDILPRV